MPSARSRRSFLIASAAVPLLGQQAPETPFSIRSREGLRLERHGDTQRPSVALYLPKGTLPSVVIEMPEHGWYMESPSAEQTWFYRMYGATRASRGTVEWSQESQALSFIMQTPSGFTLSTKATLEEEGVTITHNVRSSSVSQIAAIGVPTCVKLYRPFLDIFLERTYVHLSHGLSLVASDTPNRLAMNAEEWLPCRYIARVDKNAQPEPYRTELLDGVRRHFKSEAADAAFIATESGSGGWTVATYASQCDSVFTNPARTCQHADPIARSITDGQAILSLRVLVIKGKAEDAWKRVTF